MVRRLQLSQLRPFVTRTYGTMSVTTPKWVPTFVPIQLPNQPAVSPSTSMIRVVSYNILAQAYVKSVSFPHSPSECLRWKNRSKAVLERLLSFDADFLCLQELDEYESYYKTRLRKEGYSSVYIQRRGRKRDGCGIFFRNARVELLEEQVIDFNDLVPCPPELEASETSLEVEVHGVVELRAAPLKDSDLKKARSRSRSSSPAKADSEERGDPNDPRVRLKRDCVGILAAFRILEAPNNLVILGNTHLYWDPEWADVKLAQAKYFLSCILKFQQNISSKLDSLPVLLVMGDYNSTPGDQVYKYITSGFQGGTEVHSVSEESKADKSLGLDLSHIPIRSGDSNHEIDKIHNEVEREKALIPLLSLYEQALGEHPNTNVTPGFTGTLDYVFFQPSNSLQFINVLALPTPGAADLEGGLPNRSHPSDHLPIGADFAIR